MSKSIFTLLVGLFLSFSPCETFCQSNQPFATLDTIIHVCDSVGGFVKFHLNGDSDSYTYYWLHGPVELELDSLPPGDYTFVVIDKNGCVEIHDITIEDLEGCTMSYQILYTPAVCRAFISIRVYSSSSGLPIDESSLNVVWQDGDQSGLTREINLKFDRTYCVHIDLKGVDTTCCSIDTCIFVPRNPRCIFGWQRSTLIVNETGRRGNGDGQFVELLVVGNGACRDSLDIRGYKLDDNNGYLIPGNLFINAFNSNLIGVDPGFLIFSFSPSWSAVPNGSLIVIYDEAGAKVERLPEDDPTDANQDGVYVLPANSSQYLVGYKSFWDDSQTQWAYSGTLIPPSWSLIEISPNADGMQVRYPDGQFDHGQSLGETPFSAPNNFPVWITDASSSSYNCWFDKYDPFVKEDFICVLAEDDQQSPGLPNSEINAAYIDSLKNCTIRGLTVLNAPPEIDGKPSTKKLIVLAEEEINSDDFVTVYPNPYKEAVFLKVFSSQPGIGELRIFSVSGQFQAQNTFACEFGDSTMEIEGIKALGPGLYILQLTFPSGNVKHLRLIRIE